MRGNLGHRFTAYSRLQCRDTILSVPRTAAKKEGGQMPRMTRRSLLQAAGGIAALPRIAIAQADSRPQITIAVQALTTSNTLDPAAEQSNVGERILNSYVELLIGRNLQGQLEPMPQLATSWRRIDERTVELALRHGVKFHNGDELTAEDVAFTFGPSFSFTPAPPNIGGAPRRRPVWIRR